MITAVIVTSERFELFRRCFESIERAGAFAGIYIEMRVVLNQASPETVSYLNSKKVEIYSTDNKEFPGAARNRALKNLRTEWIYFIDDDAFVDINFFKIAKEFLSDKNNSFVGGPNLTPIGSGEFAAASEATLGNFLITASVSRRYLRAKDVFKEADEPDIILCNLFLRTSICKIYFDNRIFDSEILGGEESLLIAQLKSKNYSGKYCSDLYVWHERRSHLISFAYQMLKYGFGRGLIIKKHNQYFLFHLIPPFALIAFFISIASGHSRIFIFIYTGYLMIASLFQSLDRQFKFWWTPFVLGPIVHSFYAIGIFAGIAVASIKPLFRSYTKKMASSLSEL